MVELYSSDSDVQYKALYQSSMLRRKLVVFIMVIEWKEVLQMLRKGTRGQKTMFQETFQVVLKLDGRATVT